MALGSQDTGTATGEPVCSDEVIGNPGTDAEESEEEAELRMAMLENEKKLAIIEGQILREKYKKKKVSS